MTSTAPSPCLAPVRSEPATLTIVTVSGAFGHPVTLQVETVPGDVPFEAGWPHAANALMRLLLPKARDIIKRDKALQVSGEAE